MKLMDLPKWKSDDVVNQTEWKRNNPPYSIKEFRKSPIDYSKRGGDEVENKEEWNGYDPPQPHEEFTHLVFDRFRFLLFLLEQAAQFYFPACE